MPGNLKEKIRRGDIVVGCSLIASPGNFGRTPADRGRIEQLLNSYPYDFFTVDSQHMPYNEEALFRLCDTAREFEVPVQLRIKSPKWTYMIGGILDLCLGGVEVPQCDDAETAQEAVENFYYPQKGKRGLGRSRLRCRLVWGRRRTPFDSHTDRVRRVVEPDRSPHAPGRVGRGGDKRPQPGQTRR